jgi:peptidoglycan/LPS O-acetylase OafA/YrhL
MTSSKLENVQALRAVAAIMVLIGHGWGMTPYPLAQDFINSFSYSGVDFFFVISGFIISKTVSDRQPFIGSPWRAAAAFFMSRAVRIFPAYWLVCAVTSAFAACGYFNLAMDHRPLWRILTLSTNVNWLVPQAWTLCYEMYFYVVVTLLIGLFPTRIFQAIAAWLAITAAAIIFLLIMKTANTRVYLDGRMLEFGLGAATFLTIRSGTERLWQPAIMVGVAWWALGAFLTRETWHNTAPLLCVLAFGLPAALIIYGLVEAEKRQTIPSPKFLVSLGDVSYEIYLWHFLLIGLMVRVGLDQAWYTTFALLFFPILVAYAAKHLVLRTIRLARGQASIGTQLPWQIQSNL